MKNILKIYPLIIELFLIDAKLSTLSACTAEERQQYQLCQKSCQSAGPAAQGCAFGCWLYALICGCLTGNEKENSKFKKYLSDSTFKKYLGDSTFKKYLGDKMIQMQGKKFKPQ